MPIQVQAPDGSVAEFPDGTPDAQIEAVMRREFSATKPAAAAPKDRSLLRDITGAMANLNRGIGIGDEMAAGLSTLVNATKDAAAGRKGPGWGDRFDAEMAHQRGIEDDFTAAHPVASPLIRGTGNALTTLAPTGAGAQAMRGSNALVTAAKSGLAGATAGAGYGVADRGDAEERARAGQVGAAVGGALGTGIGGLMAKLTGGRASPMQEGMQQAEEALASVGLNIRNLSNDAVDRIRFHINNGRSGREAALAVTSTNDLPVPVPMTRGQRTGDPGQQLSENLMLRGARGSAASRHMRGLAEEQQDALRGNVAAITDQMSGGQPMRRGQGGEMVSDALNQRYDAAEQGVRQRYAAAREADAGARLSGEHGPAFAQRIREGVQDFDMERVPSVARELNRLDSANQAGPLSVREVFDTRARLTNLRSSTDSVEAAAAARAVRSLDDSVDEALTNDLISGDTNSVAAWRNAIGARRDFGRLFQGDDLIEKLTERVSRGGENRTLAVAPEDAANYILGRSDLGFVGKRNLNRDLGRLRDVLGADSEAWNGIRAETFMRLASAGEGPVEAGQRQFSGAKFLKAWTDMNRRDPHLVQALYTPEERNTVARLAAVAARVTSPVKGGDNSSNTAVTAARLLGNLRFLRGLPFVKDMANEMEVQLNLGLARRATNPNLSRAPRPAPTPGRGPSARALLGIGAAANASRSSMPYGQ
jgi:hypothetical protein